MEEQHSIPLRMDEGPDTEYNYIVHVRAFETFRNLIRQVGISIPETAGSHVSFTSARRLSMKAYKERGLVWSYSVIRVRKVEEVVEEG